MSFDTIGLYQEEFQKKIKTVLTRRNENLKILYDGYYEFLSEFHPSSLSYSPVFDISDSRWQVEISPRIFAIHNIYMPSSYQYILARFTLLIRKKNDPSQFRIFQPSSLCYFKNKYIDVNDLTKKGDNGSYETLFQNDYFRRNIQPLLTHNEAVIGVYISVYEDNNIIENYLSGIKNAISDDACSYEVESEGFFEEYFEDWNSFITGPENYEKSLFLDGNEWTIQLFKSPKNKFLSLQICNSDMEKPKKSNFYYSFVLFFRNGNDFNCVRKIVPDHLLYFKEVNGTYCSENLIKVSDLYERNIENNVHSVVENNKTVLGFYLCTYKNSEDDSYRSETNTVYLTEKISSSPKLSPKMFAKSTTTDVSSLLNEVEKDANNLLKFNSKDISALIDLAEKDSSKLPESLNVITLLKVLEEEKRNKEEKINKMNKEKNDYNRKVVKEIKELNENFEHRRRESREMFDNELCELKESFEKEKRVNEKLLEKKEKEILDLEQKLKEFREFKESKEYHEFKKFEELKKFKENYIMVKNDTDDDDINIDINNINNKNNENNIIGNNKLAIMKKLRNTTEDRNEERKEGSENEFLLLNSEYFEPNVVTELNHIHIN